MDILQQLSLIGIVPVVKVFSSEDAVPLCEALINGGIPAAEITFRTDAAAEAIRLVHERFPDMLLGAGTVLSCEQADQAWANGAAFIVTPGYNPEIVRYCIAKGYPILPGCATPGEVDAARNLGLKNVKFFPAEAAGGVAMIKSLKGPYGDMKFLPTGGIGEKNMQSYLSCGNVLAVGGSWMVPENAVAEKNWALIEALSRSAVQALLGAELTHIGINNADEETAAKEAQRLGLLLGCSLRDSSKSIFVGSGYEMMKLPFRGAHGHIAVGVNNVARAKWHMEQLGFAFDESTVTYLPDGRMRFVYLQDEIAGFAIHLVLK